MSKENTWKVRMHKMASGVFEEAVKLLHLTGIANVDS
jgi:hypothetical protein